MASLDDIFSALAQSDKAVAAEDPWDDFSNLGTRFLQDTILRGPQDVAGEDSWGRTVRVREKPLSLGESFLSGIIGGATSGIFGNLSENYRNQQADLELSVLNDALSGRPLTRPSGLSGSAFTPLARAATVFNLQRKLDSDAQATQDARELKKAIITEAAKGAAARPKYAQAILAQALGGQAPTTSPASDTGVAAASASQPGSVSPTTVKSYADLVSDLQDQGLDATAAREQAQYLRDLPLKREDVLSNMRKEFSAKAEVQDFITSDTGIKSLRNAVKDTSAASDLELIRGAIQAIEPGMAVREGEQRAVQITGALPDIWKAQIDAAFTGKSRLPEDVRQGIMRIAERRYAEHAEKFNEARQFYQSAATRQQLPGDVTYLPQAVPQQAPAIDLRGLAAQFPNTPEGRAAFKAAVAQRGAK